MVSRYPVTLKGVVAYEFNQLISVTVGFCLYLFILISLIITVFRLWV